MNKLSINYTPFAKSISSFSGLKIFDDLTHKFEIKSLFGIYLPKKDRDRGFSSWNKFYAIMMALIAGFDCLDDFDWHGEDPLFFDSPMRLQRLRSGGFFVALLLET
ncbi:MAG: hypothetical protein HOP07_17810 [Bacteriovoracaceae bacterium]|nr:hypothetical protein [Bacteriovoracaceae bacterium]